MHPRMTGAFVAMVFVLTGLVSAQDRFGSLRGAVEDEQGAAVPGVTVTMTNAVTGDVRRFVTDGHGQYLAAGLNPGRYAVSFELSGFSRVDRPDIAVLLGRGFQVDAMLRVGQLTETVLVAAESAPTVDTRSTLIAHNVTAEEFDRLPKARSFQSIALTAPSVNSGEIEGGFQINGASGAENSFTVDGVVTNGLIYGQSRQNTVFEYLQEVQVKTSGISAEYGGALGGVISAVTKSGGNVFRGEGHYYYAGSPLSAAPVRRLVLNPIDDATVGYAQDHKSPAHNHEFGGSIGGPIVGNRLFFYGAYSPRHERKTNTYNATDGTPDIARSIWTQQAFGKLSYAASRFNATWSALWTPTKATGTHSFAWYNGLHPNQYVGNVASLRSDLERGYEINQVNTSGTVDITVTDTAFIRARGGIFSDRYTDIGIPLITSYAYQTPTTTLNAILPLSVQGGTNIAGVNTTRAKIVAFDTTTRDTFDVDYNQVIDAGGLHTLKAGYGFQHAQNDISSFYPGGYVNIFWDRSFAFGGQTTGRGTYGYYEVNDRRIANMASSDIHSIYVQDQWTVGSRLTLNLGIRTENEKVPTFRPDRLDNAFEFGFGEKLAPRLGVAYDLSGNGRAKVFGSWGRYYDWTKYELPRGSFGAETWCIYYRALDTLALDSLNLAHLPGRDLWVNPGGCRDRRVPSFEGSIDANASPMSQDSVSGGLEYQLNGGISLTVHFIHTDLRDTIEDIGFLDAQGNEGYTIGNPGKGQATFQFPTGTTQAGQLTPLAQRQYDALELGFDRRFSDHWFVSANYTLSRLYGNYPGLGSSDEITPPTTGNTAVVSQQQSGSIARAGSNTSRAWDVDELLWDAHGRLDVTGRLATDRPHVVKLYGSYQTPFGTQVGAFFYGGSGTPISTYVMSTNTSGGPGSFVEGRGDMGRTPVLTRTDLLVSHNLMGTNSKRVRVELNVLNVFNQKTTRHIFNGLNRGLGADGDRTSAAIDLSRADLTKGYDYNALILASPEGQGAYDPRYGKDDVFEEGLRASLMIKFEF